MDLLLVLVVVRGLEYEEDILAVVLDLRPLVSLLRILDRELVQPEQILQLLQISRSGLVDAYPDELAGAGGASELPGSLRGQRLLMLAHAVLVMGAVDDHRVPPRPQFRQVLKLPAPGRVPSVQIVPGDPGDIQIDPWAPERDTFGPEQAALALAFGQGAVGSDDPLPRHIRVIGLREHVAGKPRRLRAEVSVRRHEAGRDAPDAIEDQPRPRRGQLRRQATQRPASAAGSAVATPRSPAVRSSARIAMAKASESPASAVAFPIVAVRNRSRSSSAASVRPPRTRSRMPAMRATATVAAFTSEKPSARSAGAGAESIPSPITILPAAEINEMPRTSGSSASTANHPRSSETESEGLEARVWKTTQ